jgi:hypothetical protein
MLTLILLHICQYFDPYLQQSYSNPILPIARSMRR